MSSDALHTSPEAGPRSADLSASVGDGGRSSQEAQTMLLSSQESEDYKQVEKMRALNKKLYGPQVE